MAMTHERLAVSSGLHTILTDYRFSGSPNLQNPQPTTSLLGNWRGTRGSRLICPNVYPVSILSTQNKISMYAIFSSMLHLPYKKSTSHLDKIYHWVFPPHPGVFLSTPHGDGGRKRHRHPKTNRSGGLGGLLGQRRFRCVGFGEWHQMQPWHTRTDLGGARVTS